LESRCVASAGKEGIHTELEYKIWRKEIIWNPYAYMGGFYYTSNKCLSRFKTICVESRQDLAFVNKIMYNSSHKSSWFVYYMSENIFFKNDPEPWKLLP
jgi:hypothetical protein